MDFEKIIEKMSFKEVLGFYRRFRHEVVEMIDLAFEHGNLSQKERDILYRRNIDWCSLEKVGQELGVNRERIRQIEAKGMEIMRQLTKKVDEQI